MAASEYLLRSLTPQCLDRVATPPAPKPQPWQFTHTFETKQRHALNGFGKSGAPGRCAGAPPFARAPLLDETKFEAILALRCPNEACGSTRSRTIRPLPEQCESARATRVTRCASDSAANADQDQNAARHPPPPTRAIRQRASAGVLKRRPIRL